MRIGIQTLQVAAQQVYDLIADKTTGDKMNEALVNMEEEKVTATVKLEFSPGENKPIQIKTSISFPVDKYKRELKDEVDEKQLSLLYRQDVQAGTNA